MTTFFRIIKFSFQNFFRNLWMSLATVSMLVLTLIVVNALVAMNVVSKAAIGAMEAKIDVSVHFKPTIEEERVQTVKVALTSLPEVKEIEYVSKEDVLKHFSEQYKNDEEVIGALKESGTNPFGAKLIIRAREIDGFPRILEALADPTFAPLIDEKNFDDRITMIERIKNIGYRVELAIFFISMLFLAIAGAIVYTTVRMSIYTHRDEISIMRLVGASTFFTRAPYYGEAIIWSILSIAIAASIIISSLGAAQPYLERFFADATAINLQSFFVVNGLPIFGIEFAVVVIMTMLTARIATHRYAKA
jgi:cell division transport system permease protein